MFGIGSSGATNLFLFDILSSYFITESSEWELIETDCFTSNSGLYLSKVHLLWEFCLRSFLQVGLDAVASVRSARRNPMWTFEQDFALCSVSSCFS